MKKLSLVLSFTFMASMIFAQNAAVVNQTKDKNKANVTQAGSKNGAQVDQVGTSNFVTVDSKGKQNEVTVVQNGSGNGAVSDPIWGFVKQAGDANIANLKEGVVGGQVSNDNDGFIDQKGNNNQATLEIMGSNNNFVDHGITQIQKSTLGTEGNTAIIKQSSFNSDMNVYQEGTKNRVEGNTVGNNDVFSVDQGGIANTASINQIGNNNNEFGSGFNINTKETTWNQVTQSGSYNAAVVSQGSDNIFRIKQYGDENKAMINQEGNNVVNTLQQGNLNTIGGLSNFVPQEVATFSTGATMDAVQLGDNNKLYVSTAGRLNVFQNNSSIASEGNTVKYTQTSAGDADLNQVGSNNLVFLKTTTAGLIDVDQNGTSNGVALYANGSASAASGSALFEGTHLNVDQTGSSNLLNLNSTGANASVDVMQNGSSNWASVVQSN